MGVKREPLAPWNVRAARVMVAATERPPLRIAVALLTRARRALWTEARPSS
jgi:hypothetical protein